MSDVAPAILSAALERVERYRDQEVVLVLSEEHPLSEPVRSAASKLRCAIRKPQVRDTPKYSLPDGYLLLQELTVNGNNAFVKALLGRVPKSRPGVVLLSCGTTYHIPLQRNAGGTWKVKESDVVMMIC